MLWLHEMIGHKPSGSALANSLEFSHWASWEIYPHPQFVITWLTFWNTQWHFSSLQVLSGALKPPPSVSLTQTAEVPTWAAPPRPGCSSPSCSCASHAPLPSSCQTLRSSGSCWVAMRGAPSAGATLLAADPGGPSDGRTARRSCSCTTSCGAASTPPPQTWSSW